MRAERRVVTVLAADVVGSTALAEQLGPEDTRIVLGETLARAVAVIESYGGTVKDLAGDGVLALFGAPVAHDDDAERAARAGLDIAADVARQAAEVERGWGLTGFAVRIGLHTGEVVVGEIGSGARVEYGATGDTVNTAARLQSAAAAGTVLASGVTARLVEHVMEVGPEQWLDLKGKAKPVAAHVLGPLRPHTASRQGGSAILVGRAAETAVGEEVLDRLAAGIGGVLWIVGDAGLGKTRLLADLAAGARQRGLGWVEGRCASYGEALPYWPIRDLLRAFFGIAVGEPELKGRLTLRRRLEALLGDGWEEALPYLAELLGLGGDLGPVAPEAVQFRTFEVVGALLSAWAAETPGAIVLDDLHWADASSLALLESLLARTESEPIVVVCAMRPDTSRLAWTLRERALPEYRHVSTVIDLAPLDAEAEVELIRRLLAGVEVPDELVQRLRAFAAGNPFYMEELVQGLGPSPGVGDAGGVDIPETLEAVILARVDRLEPQWRAVLAAASPLGRSFGVPLLEAVCDLDGEAVRQALHHLRRLDLVTEEARLPAPLYRFKHALIQEAVYRSLLGQTRTGLHRRAAEWLEEHGGAQETLYPLLAHHWLAAEDRERAIAYARLAGEQARDNNALDEAISHYRTLVRLLDDTGRGADAAEPLYQLGTILCLASRFPEAQAVWDRAFELPRPERHLPAADAELRIDMQLLPWDANPTHGYYSANMILARQLYDSLIEPSEGPSITPGMAQRWHVSPDGRTVTLFLRPDLTWSDGLAIDAEQIASSLRRSMLPGAHNADLPMLTSLEGAQEWMNGDLSEADFMGVRALDPLTLQFQLAHPAPHFLFVLMYPGAGPYRYDGTVTGPFQLEQMGADEVVLVRSPSYNRRRGGNVGRVTFTPVAGDENDDAFRSGRIDVGFYFTTDDSVRDRMVMGPPTQTIFFVLNAALADAPLRRALAAATDHDILGPKLRFHEVTATGGLVPAGLTGHTPGIAVPFDPEVARAALAESQSLAPGEPVRVWGAYEQHHDWWDDLFKSWREVLGIPIDVTLGHMADNVAFASTGYHLALWHWVAAYPDPDYFLRVLLHSGSTSNAGRWHDERFDRLIDQTMDTTAGGTARLALFHEADRLAVREACAVIPLAYRRMAILVQPHVRGWWQWGAPLQSLDRITVGPPPD